MLCICLSCCAPSRRAQQTHGAALGSPASIQHLLSLPVRTLQHWMGDAWSSCFVCFNHRSSIWYVPFWVKEKSSESSGLAQCGDVALMRRFPPSHSHMHTLWVLYPLYSQEGRQVQPNRYGRQQPDTALHSWKIWFCLLLLRPIGQDHRIVVWSQVWYTSLSCHHHRYRNKSGFLL